MSPLITVKMSLRIHPTCPPFPRARLSCLFADERMGGPCSGSFAQDKDISTLPTRGTFLLCSDLSLTLDGQSRSGIRYLRSGRGLRRSLLICSSRLLDEERCRRP